MDSDNQKMKIIHPLQYKTKKQKKNVGREKRMETSELGTKENSSPDA